jgi:hypothetical protein
MSLRRLLLLPVPVVVIATVIALAPGPGEARDAACDRSDLRRRLASGGDVFAVVDRRLVSVRDRAGNCAAPRPSSSTGLLRHVASEPGAGTAFVDDRAGGDDLVIFDESGETRVPGGAEITHPAWSERGELVWSEGMRRLVVRDPDGATERIPLPGGASAIFSPQFRGGSLIAVVAARRGRTAEDAVLDNIWSHSGSGWHRLTNFDVGGDRWSAIRTPIVAPDGSVLFVRVHGRWRRTREPAFELWRLRGDVARKVLELPGEMYLAGSSEGKLVWNALTRRCHGWELLIETAGPLRSLRCGAVQVDPVDASDPDLRAGTPATADPPSDASNEAVIIGDFTGRPAAERVAALVGDGARVVSNADAPTSVRPGAYAVVIPSAGAVARLRDLRAAFPELRRKMYVTSLQP